MPKKKDVIKEFINLHKKEKMTLPYKNKKGEDLFILTINPNITFAERTSMIDDICKIVFDGEDKYDIESYNPNLVNFAKKYVALMYFTDITMPEDLETVFELVMNTTLYDDMSTYVEPALTSIFADVDETIRTYRNTGIYNHNFKMLAKKLNVFFDKVSEQFKDIDMNEIMTMLENFKGLDTNSIIEKIVTLKK